MSKELGHDEVDLTASGEVVSAMSAAVGRLRQLAAAAFNASSAADDAEGRRPEPVA